MLQVWSMLSLLASSGQQRFQLVEMTYRAVVSVATRCGDGDVSAAAVSHEIKFMKFERSTEHDVETYVSYTDASSQIGIMRKPCKAMIPPLCNNIAVDCAAVPILAS